MKQTTVATKDQLKNTLLSDDQYQGFDQEQYVLGFFELWTYPVMNDRLALSRSSVGI